jgi:hypothetical protein
MDFSGLLACAIAVVIAATFVIVRRRAATVTNRVALFSLSLAICLLLMRPWEAVRPDEWQAGLVIVLFLAAWTAIGTLFGSWLAKRLTRT